jgi:GH25 family lysozyme M1 (1,4-beta-N-acetylmuramidase)
MKRIIDLSYYQDPNDINYDRLFSQVDGVIIRLGYGTGGAKWPNRPDPAFERHYAEAKARGKPVGCYHYIVEYKTVDEQLNVIVKPGLYGKQFELGFWADIEYERGAPLLTRSTVAKYLDTLLIDMPDMMGGIYTGAWTWNPLMGQNHPYKGLRLWVARYGSSPVPLPYGWNEWFIWQYTSSGRLDGYYGNLDMNTMSDENWEILVGEQPPQPDEILFRAEVLAKALNVRSTPIYYADNRNVVNQLTKGDIVSVYEINDANGWYRIGINRWCSGYEGYIKRIEEEPVEMTLKEWLADHERRIEALEAK